MGEDTKNEDGILKDTYTKKKGWTESIGKMVGDAIASLHERGVFGTKAREEAINEASGEPYDVEKATETQKKSLGFGKAKEKVKE
jgi:hypothetical protein